MKKHAYATLVVVHNRILENGKNNLISNALPDP